MRGELPVIGEEGVAAAQKGSSKRRERVRG
jgi:hypothetical protein